MTDSTASPVFRGSVSRVAARWLHWLDGVPYTWLAIPLRFAVATVFWNSAMAHLANWQTTLYLFQTDYRLPFLAPVPAAYLAVAIEVTAPVLLILGLLTRIASAVLLGMVAVIEIFVYPQAWPTHIQWVAMLVVLLARGPGALSVDWPVRRWLIRPNAGI
ncbi:MAG: DoxX family protein [Steroidobacteraceae bacterium]